ncbi:MAG: hypothetical protein K2X00_18260 [Nitrospiraceae bacterium]|nr:hypothetical protein [Nitrospiraceae bacterium]MBX9841829.1 hypothetical protein [Xanthobacteraceae bacterium]
MKTFVASCVIVVGVLACASSASVAVAQSSSASESDYVPFWLRGSSKFPDQQVFSGVRFDKLEWNRSGTNDNARWDMEGCRPESGWNSVRRDLR